MLYKPVHIPRKQYLERNCKFIIPVGFSFEISCKIHVLTMPLLYENKYYCPHFSDIDST